MGEFQANKQQPELLADFRIDDGQLDSVTPEQAFVAGAEFVLAWQEMSDESTGHRVIHRTNSARLISAARDLGLVARARDFGEEDWIDLEWWSSEA